VVHQGEMALLWVVYTSVDLPPRLLCSKQDKQGRNGLRATVFQTQTTVEKTAGVS
jgi:hypothetical protein